MLPSRPSCAACPDRALLCDASLRAAVAGGSVCWGRHIAASKGRPPADDMGMPHGRFQGLRSGRANAKISFEFLFSRHQNACRFSSPFNQLNQYSTFR